MLEWLGEFFKRVCVCRGRGVLANESGQLINELYYRIKKIYLVYKIFG